MYKDWFGLCFSVILERTVPAIEDGLSPFREILHSMKDLDDGRFNKVANIVGHTMQYHPHGDAISDAMVQIGQRTSQLKHKVIEMYSQEIEQQLLDTLRQGYQNLHLKLYSVRKLRNGNYLMMDVKRTHKLPVKFPLLLAQGGEGIAVGLSTKYSS